ncbi:MAG: NAD(P)-binding domain-containing protein [Rhodobacter sp.]|nr:NAD(P)-binding domain-containing protein [Rhodobacter sp.]
MSRVGFIGAGHIAAPMARALARKGHDVTVSERNAGVAASLAGAGLGIRVAPNQGVVDGADIVFLCLRPAIWADAVAGLDWRAEQQIVSVMAGVPLAEIADSCAPVATLSATIPYGFVEKGGCPLPVAGDPGAVQALFGADNLVLPQDDESALQHHFAASAVVSGVLDFLDTAAIWLAGKTANADAAEVYVANLVSGVLQHMDKSRAGSLAGERSSLATPNTLNLQMVTGLAEAGAFDRLPDILDRVSASMDKDT